MTDRLRLWVFDVLTNFAQWVLLGTVEQNEVNLEELRAHERKEILRCNDEIELLNQVERYKGRMIIMRGWILANDPGKAERMAEWFDDNGEPT